MRRLMVQHHGAPEHKDIALDYLYLDTSQRETSSARQGSGLAENDKRWRVLGRSVQLAPSQVVHLSNSSFGSIVANLDNYPKIAAWLGDPDLWSRYWNSQNGEMEAAGQIRRFGRAVLAQNLEEAARGLRARMQALKGKNNITRWRFHIVTGLAGGTGSGGFLDIVRLVRDLTRSEDAKINLYAVLPEAEDTRWSNGNYHANGYAALTEINAMQVERLQLHDLQQGTSSSLDPVNAVWLITNRNNQGIRFDVDQTLPNLIAETLYQVFVSSGDASIGTAGPAGGSDERSWIDVPTGENAPADLYAEKDDPAAREVKPFDRANRFIGFGIKRITVPSEEVKEYASLIFLRQFVLQSLNNSWVQGTGFTDGVKALDYAAIAKSPDNWEKWFLTDKHLKLETGTMPNDNARWRNLRDEFARAINGKAAEIQSLVKDSSAWPRETEEFARDFFENSFRSAGVLQFYSGAERSIEDRARLIVRDRISDYLFEQWRGGAYSVRNNVRIVAEIAAEVKARREKCDEQIDRAAGREGELAQALAKMKTEYAKLGLIGWQLHGKKRYAQIAEQIIELNAARSQRAALGFMSRLLACVLVQLDELRADVEQMELRLDEALIALNVSIASRVEGNDTNLAGSGQYKFYDPQRVRELLRRFEQNDRVQDEQCTALREKLIEAIGGKPSFRQFVNAASPGMIVASLEESSAERAETALQDVDNDRDRILGESIIQKLQEEYGSRPEELAAFLAHRVAEAQALLAIDNSEQNKSDPNWTRYTNVAFVPSRADLPEHLRGFHDRLTATLSDSGSGARVHIVDTTGQPEQIVILSFIDRVPIRVLKDVRFLKSFYDKQMSQADAKLAAMRLHAEDDGTEWPSLYAKDPGQLRDEARGHWLIAQLRELLIERANPRTGQTETLLKYMDGEDMRSVKIGTRISDGCGKIGVSEVLLLKKAVAEEIDRLIHLDDRAELRRRLGALRNAALEQAQFDETDAGFRRVDQDVAKARSLIPA